MWNAVLDAGKKHKLMVIAPAHHRRIQAGILSWGQDMDQQHNPFQCNLGYQVSLSGKCEWNKKADYVGKAALEKMGADLKAGKKPYKLQLVGMELVVNQLTIMHLIFGWYHQKVVEIQLDF